MSQNRKATSRIFCWEANQQQIHQQFRFCHPELGAFAEGLGQPEPHVHICTMRIQASLTFLLAHLWKKGEMNFYRVSLLKASFPLVLEAWGGSGNLLWPDLQGLQTSPVSPGHYSIRTSFSQYTERWNNNTASAQCWQICTLPGSDDLFSPWTSMKGWRAKAVMRGPMTPTG